MCVRVFVWSWLNSVESRWLIFECGCMRLSLVTPYLMVVAWLRFIWLHLAGFNWFRMNCVNLKLVVWFCRISLECGWRHHILLEFHRNRDADALCWLSLWLQQVESRLSFGVRWFAVELNKNGVVVCRGLLNSFVRVCFEMSFLVCTCVYELVLC